MGDRHLVVGLQARAPKTVAQLHLLVIHFDQPVLGRQIGPCRRGAPQSQGKDESELNKPCA